MCMCKEQCCGWGTRCREYFQEEKTPSWNATCRQTHCRAGQLSSASCLVVGDPRVKRAALTTVSTIQAGPLLHRDKISAFLLLFLQVAETLLSSQMLPLVFSHALHSHSPHPALLLLQQYFARMWLWKADTDIRPHQCIQTGLLDPSPPCVTITAWHSHDEWWW